MIEALVGYIQAQGFAVRVLPGALYIYKKLNGQLFTLGWAVPKIMLEQAPQRILFAEADAQIASLNQLIASQQNEE